MNRSGNTTELASAVGSEGYRQEQRRSLAIGLLRAREAVMSHFRPMLARRNVTEQQWRVIRVLSERGMMDASELADKAFILAPSLTRMLRTLEERGFITRQKDEADGRRVLLELTAAGQSVMDDVMPENREIYAHISARFGAERITELLDMLDELAELRVDPRGDSPEE